jgi:hypothetical protein
MIITYLRKADGRIDEAVAVSRRLKTKDLQSGSVIIDFRNRSIVKASLQDASVPKDWQRIVMYYRTHYADLIDQLAEANGYRLEVKEAQNAAA